jgi:diacyltrehalose acyltransferase
MINWSKRLIPVVAATSLLPIGVLATGIGHAEQAILIPGAMPFKAINPDYPKVAKTYPTIGVNFYAGDSVKRLIDYSQNPFASNSALRDGVEQTMNAMPDGADVVIIGESMGSMVAWRVAAELAKDPPEGTVRVVLIAPPEVGIAEYFKEGTYIPILNYRVTRIVPSGFDTTIVVGEYDGYADPPDRPWNLISSANALLGTQFVHGPPSFTADVTGLPHQIDTNGVKSYLIPTEHLPLTQVFRDVGVPDALVDKADEVLRPIVDAGYVRNDKPGDTRPYLADGEIHRNVQSQQQARVSPVGDRTENGAARVAERKQHRDEIRQAIRNDLRDIRGRVEARLGQLKKRIAEKLS